MNKPRIYLAGKIKKGDYRGQYYQDPDLPVEHERFWYVGPYFISCDHGCFHGDGKHGVAAGRGHKDSWEPSCGGGMDRHSVVSLCCKWISRCDIFAAEVNTGDCYGTLVEAGIAAAMGKQIVFNFSSDELAKEMWFAWQLWRKPTSSRVPDPAS